MPSSSSSTIEGLPPPLPFLSGLVRGAIYPYFSLSRSAICFVEPGLKGCSLVLKAPYVSSPSRHPAPMADFLVSHCSSSGDNHHLFFICFMRGGKALHSASSVAAFS